MRSAQVRTVKRGVDVHVRLHLTGNQIRDRHDRRGGLVPERQRDIVSFHQLGVRVFIVRGDAVERALGQILLVRDVAGDGDGWEWRRDGNVGGFGVDEEVDVGADVLGLGGLELVEVEVDVAAHEN